MADRERSDTPKQQPEDKRPKRDRPIEVGRDVPDESKERHTEIAVEAGRKGGRLLGDKH